MTDIHDILAEINESNSSNHKLAVLKANVDNELLQQILSMTHDHVKYTYGVSLKQIDKFTSEWSEIPLTLEFALASLTANLCTRKVTGHAALQLASNLIGNLPEADAELVKKIINRDLRLNFGKTQINKVWKGLITKPSYMRCDTYSAKNAKHINFPAYIQLKADGTYREITKDGETVTSRSRSGEEYSYPIIEGSMQDYPDGVFTGELTVSLNAGNIDRLKEISKHRHDDELQMLFDLGATILPRALGNGMMNSDHPPHEDIVLDVWDYITLPEYAQASLKDKKNPCIIRYVTRFELLGAIIAGNPNMQRIESHEVNSLAEALQFTSEWMNAGLEGGVLKDKSGVFKDGTPKYQLKLKLEIDCEMRITGFKPGTIGTKREGKIGAILFENDEGTIKGKTSGFSDALLEEFTANQADMVGKIMTVQFNDLSKSTSNDFWALAHPRYIEIRTDKDTTDTLEQVQKYREMAMQLK